MSTDEAYYWFWGQRPQLSYYDHPAMVAWLFFLGSKLDLLFSHSSWQISRVPSIVLAHTAIYFWYLTLKKFMTENQLIALLIFVVLSPLWGIGSLVVTPDAPLLFFWSLSIYIFSQISARIEKQMSVGWLYAILGASLGLGFCSKYHIVLFVPAALCYVLFEKKWQMLKPSHILLCILTGVLFSSPVLIWNFQNDFISFRFQLQHGLDSQNSWRLRWPIEYVFGQFFLLFPPVFLAALKKPKIEVLKMLFYFGWFPLLFFFLTSLKSKVEANWPIAAYPALTCLAFYSLQNTRALRITVGTWAVAWILVIAQILVPWVPINEHELKTYELKKFDSLIQVYLKDPHDIFASSYQMASMISYKTRFQAPLVFKAIGLSRVDYFDFQKESTPSEKKFRLFCENGQPLSKELLDLGYREISSIGLSDNFRLVEASKE